MPSIYKEEMIFVDFLLFSFGNLKDVSFKPFKWFFFKYWWFYFYLKWWGDCKGYIWIKMISWSSKWCQCWLAIPRIFSLHMRWRKGHGNPWTWPLVFKMYFKVFDKFYIVGVWWVGFSSGLYHENPSYIHKEASNFNYIFSIIGWSNF